MDLVERKDAIRCLDDDINIEGKENAEAVVDYVNRVRKRLDGLLACEIVHCNECKFAHMTSDGMCKYCQYLINEFDVADAVYFDGDYFCGAGERKDDE